MATNTKPMDTHHPTITEYFRRNRANEKLELRARSNHARRSSAEIRCFSNELYAQNPLEILPNKSRSA